MNFTDENAQLREVQKLEGHTDRVWGLSWKPTTGIDGIPAVLSTCSGDKTVRIWEQNPASRSFQLKAVIEEIHTRTVRSCAWSPCGKLLATASFDGTTAIWDEDSHGEFSCVATLEGHENEIKSVSWNASGTRIATCSRDKTVWIWEVVERDDFDNVAVLQGHTQDVKMVIWHPTMDILFSCSYDNTIKIWADDSDDDYSCVQTLGEANGGHSATVWAMAFNASGDKMVSCSDDLTLKIWGVDIVKLQSGDGDAVWTHLCTLSGYHDRTIFSVDWSKDGVICSGGGDDCIRLFVEDEDAEMVDGQCSYKLLLKKEKAHDMDVNAVRWSPKDGRVLASASDDGSVKIWEYGSQ